MGIDWNGDVGSRILRRLEADHLVWLTTVSPEGTPHPSLVWFWWTGTEVVVYSMDSMRISNLGRNPRVALNFNSDDDGGSVATLTGVARIDPSVPSVKNHPEYLSKYRNSIVDGLDMTVEAFAETYSLPVVIEPHRGQAW